MTHRAVVSLLDADHEVAVRRIWDRLAEHGLETDLWVTPIPHITYHVAAAYQDNMVENLSLVAGETRPFGIRTAGLGMFPGESPVEHSNTYHLKASKEQKLHIARRRHPSWFTIPTPSETCHL